MEFLTALLVSFWVGFVLAAVDGDWMDASRWRQATVTVPTVVAGMLTVFVGAFWLAAAVVWLLVG
jgi:hypothetical protein